MAKAKRASGGNGDPLLKTSIGLSDSTTTSAKQLQFRPLAHGGVGVSVVAIHQTSKPHELAREINKLTDGIARDEKLAGEHLLTLKGTKPPGITWEHYLRDCGVKISVRHADRLIEAFQGPTRKSPTKTKPGSDTPSEPEIEIVEEIPETPAEVEFEETTAPPVILEKLRAAELKIAGLESEIEDLRAENEGLRRRLEAVKPPERCGWVKDDGGRRAAGYGGPKNDCAARAITIATGKPYAEVFEALKAGAADYAKRWPRSKTAGWIKRSRSGGDPAHGCYDAVSARYLRSIGWQYTRARERLFLRADQLPRGRLIVQVHRHLVAVIDGVIHDAYDSGGAGQRPVQGYYAPMRTPEAAS